MFILLRPLDFILNLCINTVLFYSALNYSQWSGEWRLCNGKRFVNFFYGVGVVKLSLRDVSVTCYMCAWETGDKQYQHPYLLLQQRMEMSVGCIMTLTTRKSISH